MPVHRLYLWDDKALFSVFWIVILRIQLPDGPPRHSASLTLHGHDKGLFFSILACHTEQGFARKTAAKYLSRGYSMRCRRRATLLLTDASEQRHRPRLPPQRIGDAKGIAFLKILVRDSSFAMSKSKMRCGVLMTLSE